MAASPAVSRRVSLGLVLWAGLFETDGSSPVVFLCDCFDAILSRVGVYLLQALRLVSCTAPAAASRLVGVGRSYISRQSHCLKHALFPAVLHAADTRPTPTADVERFDLDEGSDDSFHAKEI